MGKWRPALIPFKDSPFFALYDMSYTEHFMLRTVPTFVISVVQNYTEKAEHSKCSWYP